MDQDRRPDHRPHLPLLLTHLRTGTLGHAEGSTTLRFYAQFTRPADQRAAAIIPSQLDELRKRERLRELYLQSPAADLEDLAANLGPAAGLDEQTALAWLAELAASGHGSSGRSSETAVPGH